MMLRPPPLTPTLPVLASSQQITNIKYKYRIQNREIQMCKCCKIQIQNNFAEPCSHSNPLGAYVPQIQYTNTNLSTNTAMPQSSLICRGEPLSTVHPASIIAQSTCCIRMHIATPGCVQQTLCKSKIRSKMTF